MVTVSFDFFQQLIIEICQVGEYVNILIKRINHLKVRLRRFQAVESENVPDKVYDTIKRDLRKRRIRLDGVAPMSILTNIMEILKNNKLSKYYNNI